MITQVGKTIIIGVIIVQYVALIVSCVKQQSDLEYEVIEVRVL